MYFLMDSSSPDVVIAGAGIIGASIALRLAQAGLAVTLVDAGTVGGEASWAGAGMLAPGGEVETRDAWSDLALESLRLYPDFVAELESASGIMIDYRRSGAVDVAFDEGEWQLLRWQTAVPSRTKIAEAIVEPQTKTFEWVRDENGIVMGATVL